MNTNVDSDQIIWCSKLYILLENSRLNLLSDFSIPSNITVASKLIAAANLNDEKYSVQISGDMGKHEFTLDLCSNYYQSKGDWLWVSNLEFYFSNEYLFSLNSKQKVIDIPYNGKLVNAHWLLKNFQPELTEYIKTESKIKCFTSKQPH